MIFSKKLTDQYQALKKNAPDCILLMEVGAFMKVMGEDAKAVSKVTGLKLQLTGDIDSPVIVGGFPKSGLDLYVGRLVRSGHSIAIALTDQNKERHIEEYIRVIRMPLPELKDTRRDTANGPV